MAHPPGLQHTQGGMKGIEAVRRLAVLAISG
jgi:hypothetical protein